MKFTKIFVISTSLKWIPIDKQTHKQTKEKYQFVYIQNNFLDFVIRLKTNKSTLVPSNFQNSRFANHRLHNTTKSNIRYRKS